MRSAHLVQLGANDSDAGSSYRGVLANLWKMFSNELCDEADLSQIGDTKHVHQPGDKDFCGNQIPCPHLAQ